MKHLFSLLIILCVGLVARAQYFQTGQDPASLKWRQINTENFQLIYPDYYEEQAQHLAQKLEKVYEYGSYTLNYEPRKISIILHTQTVQSNGMVAYAPRRSEFYTTPNQKIYPLDWLEQLAVHEFRHVVQIDKINDELPGIINILLGQQGTALVFGAYLPWWFIEGDAVVTETALSSYGRGRFPSFLMEHTAQLTEKGKYSYDKAYNGSYKDYVPNHYQLGYYMVANSRARYGSGVWEKVLDRVGEKPFSVTPFNTALKKETGFGKVKLYNSIFDSLAVEWKETDKQYHSLPYQTLTVPNTTYTNYTFAHWLNNDEIIAYKSGLDRIPAFVRINKNGSETVLHRPGTIFDESISSEGEWLVWSEHVPDLRWSHSGRSLIHLLNVQTGEKRKIRPEFKAFAPVISPDLQKVAVVEADFSSNYYLSVYNVENGELIKRIQTPENNYLLSPAWEDNSSLIAVVLTNHGKRLARFETSREGFEILAEKELGDIKQLRVHEGYLYFVADYSGKNAIYRMNIESRNIEELYEPRFGAAYPDFSEDGNLLMSDYTADGYRLIKINETKTRDINSVKRFDYPLAQKMAKQELGIPDLSVSDTVEYETSAYHKTPHLLNFHSWAPIFVEPYAYEFAPGVSVMSQNLLGTAETVLGYKWDLAEETGQYYVRYIYKGWYPVLDFQFSQGKRASQYNQVTNHVDNKGNVLYSDTALTRFLWKETKFSGAMKFPLNLTQGKFYKLLQPEIKYEFNHTQATSSTPSGYPIGDYHSLAYRLYFHQLLRQSSQDVWPDFGIILDGNYYHSPFGNISLGSEVGGQGILYLPGFMANHGIKMYGGIQDRLRGEHYSYSDIVRFPRGWSRVATKNLLTLGFDYKLPLFDPDLSIGGFTYIRRITTSFFYDYAYMTRYMIQDGQIAGTYNQSISSMGVEVVGDMNFLRFYAPVQLGFRASYLNEIKDFSFGLLLSVDFNSL